IQGQGRMARVQFLLMATDDSVRGAWLDRHRGHADGATVFPCVEGVEEQAIALELRPPSGFEHWEVATALPALRDNVASGWGWYQAQNWKDLIDHPLLQGELSAFDFDAGGCRHRFVIAGLHGRDFDTERLRADCSRICSTQIQHFAGSPNQDYLFLLRLSPAGAGGLEHRNNTLLAATFEMLPQADASRSRAYENLLGLISHEYFHLWNVKRIRPQAVAESDLHQPAPFPDLWAYEGVTSYMDDWMLCQAGIHSPQQYLRVIAENLTRLERTPGRMRQSLVESSQDAWIRLYQPEAHLPHSTVSYYLKGAVISLLVDLQLRLSSQGQHSLIERLGSLHAECADGDKPYPAHALEADLRSCCTDPALAALLDQGIYGRTDPDWVGLLAAFGIAAQARLPYSLQDSGGPVAGEPMTTSLGLRLDPQNPQKVLLVEAESPALQAGILAGDELLSLNGQPFRAENYERCLRLGQVGGPVQLRWLHDGVEQEATLALAAQAADRWQLQWIDGVAADVASRRAAWLNLPGEPA
ncbi:MAG: M61 family metallopeptidase, partial [Oceanococcaceae bacterium]